MKLHNMPHRLPPSPHMSMLTGKIFSRQTPPLHALTSTLNSGCGGVDEYACRLWIVRTRSFLTGKISSINGLGGGPACTLAIASIDGQSDRQGGDEDGEEESHLCLGDGSGTLREAPDRIRAENGQNPKLEWMIFGDVGNGPRKKKNEGSWQGRFWEALGGSGKLWQALGNSGKL